MMVWVHMLYRCLFASYSLSQKTSDLHRSHKLLIILFSVSSWAKNISEENIDEADSTTDCWHEICQSDDMLGE